MNSLVATGTTITVSPDQAKRLRFADAELVRLLTVSETEKSSIDEKEVDLGDFIETETMKSTKTDIIEDPEAEAVDNEVDARDARLLGKFVELTDLLPPLPKKGSFDVETIKQSQYFFS
jgi:DNA-directed RNA polymerase, mitochondrial